MCQKTRIGTMYASEKRLVVVINSHYFNALVELETNLLCLYDNRFDAIVETVVKLALRRHFHVDVNIIDISFTILKLLKHCKH